MKDDGDAALTQETRTDGGKGTHGDLQTILSLDGGPDVILSVGQDGSGREDELDPFGGCDRGWF